jgi:hypothetical protein
LGVNNPILLRLDADAHNYRLAIVRAGLMFALAVTYSTAPAVGEVLGLGWRALGFNNCIQMISDAT